MSVNISNVNSQADKLNQYKDKLKEAKNILSQGKQKLASTWSDTNSQKVFDSIDTQCQNLEKLINECIDLNADMKSSAQRIYNQELEDKKRQEAEKNNKAGGSTYTIQSGDSFWKIAHDHNVDMYELANYNNMSINDVIRPGQEIKIPKN